jgi:hypothetical protein
MRVKARSHTGVCLMIIIGTASFYFGTVHVEEEEFQRVTFVFVVFCSAGQSENPDLGARLRE